MQKRETDSKVESDEMNNEGGVAVEEEPEQPSPGIEHYPEPDAENIMPIEDRPGTF